MDSDYSRVPPDLHVAKIKGYKRWDHARADLDLKPLHGYASFEQLVN